MNTVEELCKQLPDSWSKVKLKQFKKMLPLSIREFEGIDGVFNGADNTIAVLSVLLNESIEYLEALPMKDINALISKVSFIQTMPTAGNSTIKWKKLEDISYNDFVAYAQLSQNPIENLTGIIKILSAEKLTDETIEELDMQNVYTGFFLLRKYLKRLTENMFKKSVVTLMKIQIKHLIQLIQQKLGTKKG